MLWAGEEMSNDSLASSFAAERSITGVFAINSEVLKYNSTVMKSYGHDINMNDKQQEDIDVVGEDIMAAA